MKIKTHFLTIGFLLTFSIIPTSYAVTFTVLHHFTGADGANPMGSPSMDARGNLYGTTFAGGKNNLGTIFKLNGTKYSVLHNFTGANGQKPIGSLLADAEGNLYGTTFSGGNSVGAYGTVFSYDRELGYRIIKSFATKEEGSNPWGGLTRDAQGNLYGTTSAGGNLAGSCSTIGGCGTIFKINPAGIFQQLHQFNNTDGFEPDAQLLRVGNKLYGGTLHGGSYVAGSPFFINTNGTGFGEVTITSANPSLGFFGGQVRDKSGNLYGTYFSGLGPTSPLGGIYKIDKLNNYQIVYQFNANGTEGAYSSGSLVMDANGKLYGTTKGNGIGTSEGAGEGGFGTVFRFDPATNVFTTLHTFTGGADGGNPFSGLITDPSNTYFYGVAEYGGNFDKGVVFRIQP